ncbi:ATP-binding cassette domain-containing protein [Pirellulales bacterium]|jgi:ATP-binding cassette subfamily F protein uup|nr:ATP-binding cassette domain-containing protein [Pirellulales bacterium]
MAVLTLDDLSLAFRGVHVLDKVSRTIEPGEKIGLLGRNGTGKTTLLRLIAGSQEPDSGTCVLAGGKWASFLPQEVPVDMVGQVLEVVQEALRSQVVEGRIEDWEAETKSQKIIDLMGLDSDGDIQTLSAGRKRRVLLARALVTEPDLLMLDEPTNHLDLEAIEWLEKFLSNWRGTLLFVTHDRGFLRRVANRIWELDRGQLFAWECDYDVFLERKAAAIEAEGKQNALFDKRLAEEEVWIRQGIKARRTRNEGRVRALKQMREERQQRREQPGKANIAIQESGRSGTLVCKAADLCFGYADEPVISDFSTTILRGDKVGFIGPNGCGKTTLLRLLLQELEPQTGSVRLGTKLAVRYFDQLRGQLDFEKSVVEQINGGNDFVTIDGNRRHVFSYLQDFLFTADRVRLPVKFLSGGERNRLLLAKLFARPANVLVLDEPTNDLDLETLELLEQRLVDFQGTVLAVSHDREFLDNVVTSVIAFDQGSVQEYVGGYSDWIRQRGVVESPRKSLRSLQKKSSASLEPEKLKPRKLSFKEKRELEQLPAQIEKMEADVAGLHEEMADASFYRRPAQEIAMTQKSLQELEDRMAIAYARWQDLEKNSQ